MLLLSVRVGFDARRKQNYYVMKDYMNYIEVNAAVMFGKPVVKVTHITVELILEELGVGRMIGLLKAHPNFS